MKNRLKLNRKGSSAVGMVVTIVLVSTSLVIGVWIMSSMQGAITFTTTTVSENLTLVNNTASTVTYPLVNSITSIVNSTGDAHLISGTQTLCTGSTAITCFYNATHSADTNPSIVTYAYNRQAANDTLGQMFTTTWSSFQLGVVSLIVIAAVAIIGLLVTGFGKAGGPA